MQSSTNSAPHLAVCCSALWSNFNGILDEADVHIFIPHVQIHHENDCLQQTERHMPHYKFRYTFLKTQLKQNGRENGQQKNYLSDIRASEKCPTFIKIRMKLERGENTIKKNRIIRIIHKITQSDNLRAQNTTQLVDFYSAGGLTQFNCFLFILTYLKSQI